MPITDYALNNREALGIRPQRLEALENLISNFIERDLRQTIIVKASLGGSVIFEGCYGTNTKEYGVKSDTIFPVASITKPVISALLLCLQEDGLVDLCEPVFKYLPEFCSGGREKICPWHFLTHTSGLKEEEIYSAVEKYISDVYGLKPPKDGSGPEDYIALEKLLCNKMGLDPDAKNKRLNDPEYMISLRLPINHAPRSHMTYCNYGYQRLKEIVDAVTGEPIDAFAQKRLFGPLGMADTYWKVPKDKWGRILGRKENCEGAPWINSQQNYESESGSGGLKTTVDDIMRFGQMILNGGVFNGERVLAKRSIAEMTKNHNDGVLSDGDASNAAWGLGWNIRLDKKDDSGILRSPRCIDHGGWAGTKFMLDPETNLVAAIFTAEYKATDTAPIAGIYGPILNTLYSALDC